MNENTLKITRLYEHSIQDIFDAFKDPALLQQWFYAGDNNWSSTVKSDFVEGGKYEINMHDGEGQDYLHHGIYEKIVENKEIVFTWNSMAVKDTKVSITLSEVDGKTQLTLIHELLPDEESNKQHEMGWNIIAERLDTLLRSKV